MSREGRHRPALQQKGCPVPPGPRGTRMKSCNFLGSVALQGRITPLLDCGSVRSCAPLPLAQTHPLASGVSFLANQPSRFEPILQTLGPGGEYWIARGESDPGWDVESPRGRLVIPIPGEIV